MRHLRLDDGELLYNDVRVPLVAQSGRFDLALDYGEADGRPAYLGQFHWQQMEFAAQRYLPFASDVAASLRLRPIRCPSRNLCGSGRTARSTRNSPYPISRSPTGRSVIADTWTCRTFARILRQPTTPDGRVDFSGDGHYSGAKLALTGRYSAAGIAMPYQWFHTKDIASRGSYHADERSLEVPDFSAQAFGGGVTGRVHLDFRGLKFRADTRAEGFNLAAVFAAVNNPNLPITPLHWDGLMDVQSVTTWEANFKNFDSRGTSRLERAQRAARDKRFPSPRISTTTTARLRRAVSFRPAKSPLPRAVCR